MIEIAAQGRSDRKNSAFRADLTSKCFRVASVMCYAFSRQIVRFKTLANVTQAKYGTHRIRSFGVLDVQSS